MKNYLYVFIAIQIVIAGCTNKLSNKNTEKHNALDLEQIRKRGKIIAVTDYNSTNYFIYKGSPMGFQFEILEDFADHIGLQLEIKVEDNISIKEDMLANQDCDIIAINMPVDIALDKNFTCTNPHSKANQVLIQRINNRKNNIYISDYSQLAGKTVYVSKNQLYKQQLHDLINEIHDTIYIREVDETPEELIEWVSKGKIDYTLCYENIALINKILFSNIDIDIRLSEKQGLGWIVRSDSPELLKFINEWLEDYRKTVKYAVLYKRYFVNGKLEYIAKSDYSTFGAGKMSVYDYAIKKYSQQIGWDWKLLASLIYQESRFKKDARSWAGAYGLMQLMPSTARQFGVDTTSGPEENIRAGVKYLKWLDKQFKEDIIDKNERIKFILASYNIGFGHIQDARRLARKHGKNANIWENNVEYFLLSKSKPEYYNDSVVKYGSCKGTETYRYVKEIIERYQHYTNLYVEN